jgi:benzoyl-CoA reductase/2-hydroxyglutaryl-CoA dehydratase subunit BcrC/BadD/HgdB
MSKRLGLTSTVPHEIIVAAGGRPIDLNNVFIADPQRDRMLDRAETEGFPPGVCAWIKGIYAAAVAGAADAVVTVTSGDCANTRALAEVLRHRGVDTIPFAFPPEREPADVARALADFAARLGTTMAKAEAVRRRWAPLRRRLAELDRLAWEEGRVGSAELHAWLVSASDFQGDADRFDAELQKFLRRAKRRRPAPAARRLALLGVPPIYDDLFAALETRGARIVFDEVPRQFAMPYDCADLVEQFCRYTYPYELPHRLNDLAGETARRGVHGVLHYLQAFCHRQIEHIVIKERLPLPTLALEGDRPGPLSGQLATRLDAFLEMLA